MKNSFNLLEDWLEIVMIFFLGVGVFIAVISRNTYLSYFVIIISGFFFGTLLYKSRSFDTMPRYFWMFSFLLGYLLGSFFYSWKLISLLFVLSSITAYFMYSKGLLRES